MVQQTILGQFRRLCEGIACPLMPSRIASWLGHNVSSHGLWFAGCFAGDLAEAICTLPAAGSSNGIPIRVAAMLLKLRRLGYSGQSLAAVPPDGN